MTGYECYQTYLALRLHFQTDNYDYFKYQGKMRKASRSAYAKRDDKVFFESLARQSQNKIKNYFVATFVTNHKGGFGIVGKEMADKNYIQWRKRIESLAYIFKEECVGILDCLIEKKTRQLGEHPEFTELFTCARGKHPVILQALLGKRMSMETVVVLNQLIGFVPMFDEYMKNDHIWKEYGRLIKKYDPFISVNLIEYRDILKDVVAETKVIPNYVIQNCGTDTKERHGVFKGFAPRDFEAV